MNGAFFYNIQYLTLHWHFPAKRLTIMLHSYPVDTATGSKRYKMVRFPSTVSRHIYFYLIFCWCGGISASRSHSHWPTEGGNLEGWRAIQCRCAMGFPGWEDTHVEEEVHFLFVGLKLNKQKCFSWRKMFFSAMFCQKDFEIRVDWYSLKFKCIVLRIVPQQRLSSPCHITFNRHICNPIKLRPTWFQMQCDRG